MNTDLTRRDFMNGLIGATASLIVPTNEIVERTLNHYAATCALQKPELVLSFYNIHTGESLKNCVFWAQEKVATDGLAQINRLFRDHRSNCTHPIDPNLLKLLHQVHQTLDTNEPIHLISGFRSAQTNACLRASSNGVAKNSQHLYGKAADIAIPGRSLQIIKKAAIAIKGGGVGCYSQFVHIDTGRVRTW